MKNEYSDKAFPEEIEKHYDPVCGMLVQNGKELVFSHRGQSYYFCSEKCRSLFEQEPDLFISMQSEREKIVEAKRAESLQKMASQITHEIRNPLTSIGGFARRIIRSLPEDTIERKYMERVIEDVKRLEDMVNRLVKIEPAEFVRRPVEVNRMIKGIVGAFRSSLHTNSIKLKLKLQEVPKLFLDEDKTRTAIANIIQNAIEAMDKEEKILKISTFRVKEHVLIEISDTGRGIAEEKLKYIFDPFFTSKVYGPGLGLAYTKEVIKAHGGSIEVKSKVGKGTTFKISFPLKKED